METQNVHERCQPLTSFHKTKSSLSCSSSFRISLACQAAKHLNSPSGLKDLIVCPFVTQRPMQPLKHIFICQHQHQMAAAGLSTFSSHAMPHPAPQRAANKDLRSHSSTSEASEVQCSCQHQTMVIQPKTKWSDRNPKPLAKWPESPTKQGCHTAHMLHHISTPPFGILLMPASSKSASPWFQGCRLEAAAHRSCQTGLHKPAHS